MRFLYWPRFSRLGLAGGALFGALAAWAALEESWVVAALLGGGALLLAISMLHDCAAAGGIVTGALDDQDEYAPSRAVKPELAPVLNGAASNGSSAGIPDRRMASLNGHAHTNGAVRERLDVEGTLAEPEHDGSLTRSQQEG